MLARQIAIGFGIAIVFPLLVYYGVRTAYSPPKWDTEIYSSPMTAEERQRQRERREAYIAQSREFARVLIIASTPLGIAAILIGTFVSLPALGTGLILGGIFTVAHGYWGTGPTLTIGCGSCPCYWVLRFSCSLPIDDGRRPIPAHRDQRTFCITKKKYP
jgi:hypothetical protein